jgi:hypothetical protein
VLYLMFIIFVNLKVNKILFSFKRYLNLFFLNKNQKKFIKHNYETFKSHEKNNLDKKIILMEINGTEENTIASSYIANQLSKKYNANLTAYFPRIPRKLSRKLIWKFRCFIGSPTFSIFKSFGVNSFIIPSLNNHILKESSKIYNAQLPLINNKNDIESITINGILFGDLIYDYYLNYHKEPTIYTETKTFKRHLNYCIQLIVYWNNFFIDNDVEAINVSHTVYTNAIPLRIAAKLGINCFQANGNDIYRLTDENIFAYRDFVGFKKNFERLSHEQKVSGIKKAKDRIEKRLSGEVGVDMSYSKKSAFTPPSRKRLLNKSDKIKILIAPHCFFDSPHPLGLNFYPDVFAWLEELVEISCQTDYEWYVKTHPDFIVETKLLVESFFKPYPNFKLLPSDSSHIQLIEEGIDFALTIWGTIGFEYAAMNKPVINASLNNPHAAYNFNINPKSKEEYKNILMNLKDVNHKINVDDVYEYYYMKHLHYNKNWLFKNYENYTSFFNSNMKRTSSDVYLYWLNSWTEERHEEILNSVSEFIVSGNYRLISD